MFMDMMDMTTDTDTLMDTHTEIKSPFLREKRSKEVQISTLTVLSYTFLATSSTQLESSLPP
jgi:hypothetical protein